MAAEAIEAKVILHFIDKGCYNVRKSLFESINKIIKAESSLFLSGIALVSTVSERNCPEDIVYRSG